LKFIGSFINSYEHTDTLTEVRSSPFHDCCDLLVEMEVPVFCALSGVKKDIVRFCWPDCAYFLWFSVAHHGLEEPSSEVAAMISHATQERLRNIVEKLAVIAEHRIDLIKVRGLCEHMNVGRRFVVFGLSYIYASFMICEVYIVVVMKIQAF
jgi:hypothetical protein